jgi:hypothetical protein
MYSGNVNCQGLKNNPNNRSMNFNAIIFCWERKGNVTSVGMAHLGLPIENNGFEPLIGLSR